MSIRKGFSNLREYVGDVDRYYLFKNGKTITVSDLPSEDSHPSNFLRGNEGEDGFNPPVKHVAPLGSASLQTDSFTIGKKSKHNLYGHRGLFVDDTPIDVNNTYIHKNFLHEGEGSLVELGDCPQPIADEYGTINCLEIICRGAPIFLPEWDRKIPMDVFTNSKYRSALTYTNNEGEDLNVVLGQKDDVCERRARYTYYVKINKGGMSEEEAQEYYDDCYNYCTNPNNISSNSALLAAYPKACIDEESRSNETSNNLFQQDCGCRTTYQDSDMVLQQETCGFDLLMNEHDFRFIVGPSTDLNTYSESNWSKSLDNDLLLNTLSVNQQTDIYGEDFTAF